MKQHRVSLIGFGGVNWVLAGLSAALRCRRNFLTASGRSKKIEFTGWGLSRPSPHRVPSSASLPPQSQPGPR